MQGKENSRKRRREILRMNFPGTSMCPYLFHQFQMEQVSGVMSVDLFVSHSLTKAIKERKKEYETQLDSFLELRQVMISLGYMHLAIRTCDVF